MQSNLAIQTGGTEKKQRDIQEFEILRVTLTNKVISTYRFLNTGRYISVIDV